MSRKPPSDTFTRFTSTTPSMSSQSPSFTSQTSSSSEPPLQPTETPQQRVARLRAQHLRRKRAELTTTDRVLAGGRRFADVAHRATTYTLLGFTVVASLTAVYGFFSLVSHNRTQKRAWIEREMDRLEAARVAFLKGEADAEQLHLLEQERAGEEIRKRYEEDKRRKKEQGWFANAKGLFKGKGGDMGAESESLTLTERARALKDSEQAFEDQQAQLSNRRFKMGDAEMEFRPAALSESGVEGVGLDKKGRPVPMSKMEAVSVRSGQGSAADAVQQAQGRRGGELDSLAANISSSAQEKGSSWWRSIFGASKS